MTIPCFYIGCDIAKDHLDFYDPRSRQAQRIANTDTAIAGWLDGLEVEGILVVFEATGPYDRGLRQALTRAGIVAARVNPAHARHFAKSMGYLAKTDTIDARMLAEMGQRLQPDPTPSVCPQRRRLRDLSCRRDQLVEMRKKEKTRLKQTSHDVLDQSIGTHIDWLSSEIKHIENTIGALIGNVEHLNQDYRLISSVPGIGPVTATLLLALMPELGTITRRAIAALAGVAPINNDSGKRRGQRSIRGGRQRVRRAIYMAAIAAITHDNSFAVYYRSLRKTGKPAKVAIIAVARKILVTANAIVRTKKPFSLPA